MSAAPFTWPRCGDRDESGRPCQRPAGHVAMGPAPDPRDAAADDPRCEHGRSIYHVHCCGGQEEP